MRLRIVAIAVLVVAAYGCASTAPPTRQDMAPLTGTASWYGEEFAGRTTANGEIFDPAQLTAAHRSLPFGTVLDVTNAKTRRSVRVRVNDRGPYISNRVIDLSYAAAQQIGLIEPGIGEVEIKVVKVGDGDREAPRPLGVTVAEAPKTVPVTPPPSDAPPVAFPVPEPAAPAPAVPATAPVTAAAPAEIEPVVVDRVEVQTQRGETITRRQVADDGRSIEEVPVATAPARTTEPSRTTASTSRPATTTQRRTGPRFHVQVGAFAVEENAKALQERLTAIGQRAVIDRTTLYRVRIGPFATRDEAAAARTRLEANGISAIIVSD